MLTNGGRRNLCLLLQGRLRPVQPVLLRAALRPVRAGAQVKVTLGVAPHGGRHRGTAGEGREVVKSMTRRRNCDVNAVQCT